MSSVEGKRGPTATISAYLLGRRVAHISKADLRSELAQAVQNTADLLVPREVRVHADRSRRTRG